MLQIYPLFWKNNFLVVRKIIPHKNNIIIYVIEGYTYNRVKNLQISIYFCSLFTFVSGNLISHQVLCDCLSEFDFRWPFSIKDLFLIMRLCLCLVENDFLFLFLFFGTTFDRCLAFQQILLGQSFSLLFHIIWFWVSLKAGWAFFYCPIDLLRNIFTWKYQEIFFRTSVIWLVGSCPLVQN